jgi:hypothetical protein
LYDGHQPEGYGAMDSWSSLHLGKVLVIAGIIFVAVGLVLMAGSKLSFFGLGHLPGDVVYKGKNVQFYFPIVTCLVLSVVLTLVLWLISFLTKR